jgi:hypothetical protein
MMAKLPGSGPGPPGGRSCTSSRSARSRCSPWPSRWRASRPRRGNASTAGTSARPTSARSARVTRAPRASSASWRMWPTSGRWSCGALPSRHLSALDAVGPETCGSARGRGGNHGSALDGRRPDAPTGGPEVKVTSLAQGVPIASIISTTDVAEPSLTGDGERDSRRSVFKRPVSLRCWARPTMRPWPRTGRRWRPPTAATSSIMRPAPRTATTRSPGSSRRGRMP